jgi:hypothetical protein
MTKLDLKILSGKATADESAEYLRLNGIDPDEVVKQGVVFIKTLQEKIAIQNKIKEMYSGDEVIALVNSLYSALTTDSTYDGVWLDEWFDKNLKKP